MAETVGTATGQKVRKTEAEWRELLTPEQFYVMRQKGTERAFTGALVDNHEDGVYHCGASSRGADGRVSGCRCRRTRSRPMRTPRWGCGGSR